MTPVSPSTLQKEPGCTTSPSELELLSCVRVRVGSARAVRVGSKRLVVAGLEARSTNGWRFVLLLAAAVGLDVVAMGVALVVCALVGAAAAVVVRAAEEEARTAGELAGGAAARLAGDEAVVAVALAEAEATAGACAGSLGAGVRIPPTTVATRAPAKP